MAIKAIVFDWDGVLVDTLEILKEVYYDMADHFNVPKPENVKDHFDISFEAHWTKLGFGDRLEEVKEYFLQHKEKFRGKGELFIGIVDMLEELGKKTTIAMITNNSKDNIVPLLEEYNIDRHFVFIHDNKYGHLKPHIHTIQVTAKQLGITPEEMIYVGDMDAELEMAKKAGAGKVIGCTYGYPSEKRLGPMNPDLLVHTPEELHAALLEAIQ